MQIAVNLHPKDAHALEVTVNDLRRLHGNALESVVLWGEAATESYRPRRSPLLLAVVLTEVTATALAAMAGRVRAWRRRRIEVPLVFDSPYIASSADVFPLEFLDLLDRHLLLSGANLFATLEIDREHLRGEVEEQLRGKLLHLWGAYLESAGSRFTLRRLLTQTPAAFEVALRGMLHLGDCERPRAPLELLEAVERSFSVSLPVMRRLEAARQGAQRLPWKGLDGLFAAYLEEVRTLVRVADGM